MKHQECVKKIKIPAPQNFNQEFFFYFCIIKNSTYNGVQQTMLVILAKGYTDNMSHKIEKHIIIQVVFF